MLYIAIMVGGANIFTLALNDDNVIASSVIVILYGLFEHRGRRVG